MPERAWLDGFDRAADLVNVAMMMTPVRSRERNVLDGLARGLAASRDELAERYDEANAVPLAPCDACGVLPGDRHWDNCPHHPPFSQPVHVAGETQEHGAAWPLCSCGHGGNRHAQLGRSGCGDCGCPVFVEPGALTPPPVPVGGEDREAAALRTLGKRRTAILDVLAGRGRSTAGDLFVLVQRSGVRISLDGVRDGLVWLTENGYTETADEVLDKHGKRRGTWRITEQGRAARVSPGSEGADDAR